MALPVIPQSVINKIVSRWKANEVLADLLNNNYVAPTFFLQANKNIARLNYYDTKEKALRQLYYLAKEPGFSKPQTAKGSISFTANSSKAQTAGINIDMYAPLKSLSSFPIPYSLMKELVTAYPYFIVRFSKTDGSGPYYAVFHNSYFGIAATVVTASGEKLAAMKDFYENLAVIKGQYNALVSTLNDLISKPVNPITQQSINQLTQKRITLLENIRSIPGVSLIQNEGGVISGIGILPIAYIVAIVVVGAGGWGLSTWIKQREKSKQIKASFSHQNEMMALQNNVLALCANGTYDKEICTAALKNLGMAIKTGQDVANNASENSKGLFGEIGDTVKWIALALIGVTIIKATKN